MEADNSKAADELNTNDTYSDNPPLSWMEPEHQSDKKTKTVTYLVVGLIVLSMILLDVLIFKNYTISFVVLVGLAALIIYYRKPPRAINYRLSPDKGIYIDETLRSYEEFSSFGVIAQQDHSCIILMPLKRFGQSITVYFPEQYGERIVDILSKQLPMKEIKLNPIDKTARKLGL